MATQQRTSVISITTVTTRTTIALARGVCGSGSRSGLGSGGGSSHTPPTIRPRRASWAHPVRDRVGRLTGAQIIDAIEMTAAYRRVQLRPPSGVLGTLAERRQGSYAAWRRKQGPDADSYPESFADVTTAVVAFADPLLIGVAASECWDPITRSWLDGGTGVRPAARTARGCHDRRRIGSRVCAGCGRPGGRWSTRPR